MTPLVHYCIIVIALNRNHRWIVVIVSSVVGVSETSVLEAALRMIARDLISSSTYGSVVQIQLLEILH